MTDNIALWRLAYVLPNLLAALGMALVAAQAWRFRKQRGGWALWVFAVSAAIWAFTEGLSYVGLSPELIFFIWGLGHIGISSAPLAMVVFALVYIGYGHLLTRRRIVLLSILPAANLLCAWTNNWHGWVWSNVWMETSTPFPMLAETHGPFLWIYSAYSILLILGTIYFLIRRLVELPAPQRRQQYLVLVAMLLPVLAAVLYMTELTPLPTQDLTPMAFNISGFVLLWGFMREQLFELAPVTAHEIYRSMADAVFVIDAAGRVQDLNNAARRLLPSSVKESVGLLLSELLPEVGFLLSDTNAGGEMHVGEYYYDVQVMPLISADQRFAGRLLALRDISERKRLEAELRRMAVTDALTGLYNRRHFCAQGEDEIEHAQRYKRPLSMIMMDIDYFKEVNDRHGHEAGDRVLVALAGLMVSELRTSDCTGRIGGEEFALLLPETDEAAAHELGRRLLDTIAAMSVSLEGDQVINVTVSAGVATLTASETGMTQFMRRADNALYQAKHTGRGRLVQSA